MGAWPMGKFFKINPKMRVFKATIHAAFTKKICLKLHMGVVLNIDQLLDFAVSAPQLPPGAFT
jgi:hypothetical protein